MVSLHLESPPDKAPGPRRYDVGVAGHLARQRKRNEEHGLPGRDDLLRQAKLAKRAVETAEDDDE